MISTILYVDRRRVWQAIAMASVKEVIFKCDVYESCHIKVVKCEW
jgi:hypothetical protein